MSGAHGLRFARVWFAIGVAIIAVTLYFALKPGGAPGRFPNADKLYHAGAFFLNAAWFGGLFKRRAYPWLGAALVLFGIGIEVAQYVMPYGRTAEIGDVLADVAGIVLGLLLALWLRESLFARIEQWLRPH